jgi:hypothetical protein
MPGGNYDDMEVEVLFDDGQITLEMHDLFIAGNGMLTDPETKYLEVMHFKGPISTGNIVIKLEEIINHNDMYPKFNIEEVNLVLDEPNTQVTALGQTPLFKTQKFEKAVKKWLHDKIKVLTSEVRAQLIEVEKNIWTHIPFEY